MAAALEARDLTTTYGHVEPPAGAAAALLSHRVLAVQGHAGTTRIRDVQAGRSRRT